MLLVREVDSPSLSVLEETTLVRRAAPCDVHDVVPLADGARCTVGSPNLVLAAASSGRPRIVIEESLVNSLKCYAPL